MGGRSNSDSDAIAFIHAADAQPWAVFLQNKLNGDDYNIRSFLHNPCMDYLPSLFSSGQMCAVLVTPALLEPSYTEFWTRCADSFNPRTLFLFLGADADDLRASVESPVCDKVLRHQLLQVDGTKEMVTIALIKLIEAYETAVDSLQSLDCESKEVGGVFPETDSEPVSSEDLYKDETIYDYPPRPRQHNNIVRVMPTELYEHGPLDVLILMEREAEEALTMVTESACSPSRHIVMHPVTSNAYIATLPSNLLGKVNFSVAAGDHILGQASVHVHSRLVQLYTMLQKESSPLTLMCKAMGLSAARASELEELDSWLARRLSYSQFPSGLRAAVSADQVSCVDQEDSQWPTLLHFAAEFNLRRTCDELLRYPNMINAACTENNEGLFPCQLAEKNGYKSLHKRLLQYVEDMSLRQGPDSGISDTERLPPPARHHSISHVYVNNPASRALKRPDSSEDYIEMHNIRLSGQGCGSRVMEERVCLESLPPPAPCRRKVTDGYAKPRSFSEGCVKTPYVRVPSEARIAEEEDGKENEPPTLQPKTRAKSAASECLTSGSLSLTPQQSQAEIPTDTSSPELDSNPSPTSMETPTSRLSLPESEGAEEQIDEAQSEVATDSDNLSCAGSQSESRPTSHASSGSSQSDIDVQQGLPGDDSPVLRSKLTKRSRSVQDKISNFFKKIKPPRRQHSASEGDVPGICKASKKSVIYTRQSTASTDRDVSTMRNERDSGGFYDEQESPVLLRSRSPEGVLSQSKGKRSGFSMQRRESVRVEKARREEMGGAPSLPPRGRKNSTTKETFVSFLE